MDLQDLTSFKSPKFEPEKALRTAVGASAAPLWAAFFAAAAGGAAFWWMTSWTRRKAEAEAGGGTERLSFAPSAEEGPAPTRAKAEEIVAEEVMAHQPEPEALATPAEDATTDTLPVEPAEVMEHAPLGAQPVAAEAGPVDLTAVAEALTIEAASALKPEIEEAPASLAVAKPAKPRSVRRKPAASLN